MPAHLSVLFIRTEVNRVHTFVKRKLQVSPQVEFPVVVIDATELQARVGAQDLESSEWNAVSQPSSTGVQC